MARNGLLGLVVALALAGCAAQPAARPPVRTATHDSAESSTAAPRPTTTTTADPRPYSFDGSVPPPEIHQTGTDYGAITISLERYGAWLYAHSPDDALIPRVAAPGSNADYAFRHDLAQLRKYDRRLIEVETAPTETYVIDARADVFVLRYRQHLKAQLLFDRRGRIRSRRDFASPTTDYIILCVRSPDGIWRLAHVEEQ